MSAIGSALARVVDMRRGEGATLLRASGSIFLLLLAQSTLETARDTLLLTHWPARNLGAVYALVAVAVLPIAAVVARASRRRGSRWTLAAGLLAVAVGLVGLFALPVGAVSVLAAYALSATIGAVLVPLFWSLLAGILTLTESRRLLGPIAAAGTAGTVMGSGAAAVLLGHFPPKALLVVSATLAAAVVLVLPGEADETSAPAEPAPPPSRTAATTAADSEALLRHPFVRRLALLVAASTLAAILLDFDFKWTVARVVTPDRVGPFVARFYALQSLTSLVAQLALARVLVRRLGVAWSISVVPTVVFGGATLALLSGGTAIAVLVLKAVDATLRQSVYRMTMELAYLPLPTSTRTRAKPLIDGALVRTVQGVVGLALLAGGAGGALSPRSLIVALIAGAGLWLLASRGIRSPYLALLRGTVGSGSGGRVPEPDPLDLQSAEALLGHLSDEDALVVVGAMNALARRGGPRLIPGLILLHEQEAVLTRALAIFAESEREDWIARGRRLLRDPREGVRMAAARALASHGRLEARDLAEDVSPRVRGYAALYLALEAQDRDALGDPNVARILGGDDSEEERLGLLAAIADASPDERLVPLLADLAARRWSLPGAAAEIGRAAASQRAVSLIPALIARLSVREGRENVRAALLSFGPAALEGLRVALADPSSPRDLRIHIPSTLARFGSRRAADLLLQAIETDFDGMVRYKALRALGRLVAERGIRSHRGRVERLALSNLVEYFRLLGLRARLDSTPPWAPEPRVRRELTERLLLGMLDDKLRQSLERAFRLLKIAYPREDLHGVHVAYVSPDKRKRAHAVEFLDALLRRKDQARLRLLLRAGAEEPSLDESLQHASAHLPERPPKSREEALERLVRDADLTLAGLAKLHTAARAGEAARVFIGSTGPSGQAVELGLDPRSLGATHA
jgi:AAA family ATP:ADP antiporter